MGMKSFFMNPGHYSEVIDLNRKYEDELKEDDDFHTPVFFYRGIIILDCAKETKIIPGHGHNDFKNK